MELKDALDAANALSIENSTPERWAGLANHANKVESLQIERYSRLYETRGTWLWVVPNFTNLRILSMPENMVMDFRPLAKLKELRRLDVSTTWVRFRRGGKSISREPAALPDWDARLDRQRLAAIFETVRSNTKLEDLDVSFAFDVEIDDLTPFASLTKLRRLSLSGLKICDLRPLQKLTNLETLEIAAIDKTRNCSVADFGLRELLRAGRLKKVILGCTWTDEHLETIVKKVTPSVNIEKDKGFFECD